jgi:hypothetical protein
MTTKTKVFKLYEIPRESRVEGARSTDGSTALTFHRLDGMYSYCTTEKGNIVHLRASSDLEKIRKGVYKLKTS